MIGSLDNESDDDDEDSDTDPETDDADDEEDIIKAVHPLDLVYIVFLCADDFLRQELSNKLARCQYAVPLILPPPEQNKHKAHSTVLHWGLKTISRVFYDNDNVVNSTLIDLEAPLITCFSLGMETSWKSKLLNEMLSPHQKSFWHQGLKGGDYKQRVSQGMAEVAWDLPGRQGDNKFPYPLTFVNVRGCSKYYDRLCRSSTVTCIFTEDADEELTETLEKEAQLEKVVVVILHKKENEKKVKKAALQLQKKFHLEKHQIVRRPADDVNFSSVEEKFKRSIESIIESRDHRLSLSTFVRDAKADESMKTDGNRCYVGQMAAKSILKDIDEINTKNSGRAKTYVLPLQSDLKSRKEIAQLDKEQHRQERKGEGTSVDMYAAEIKEKRWKLQRNQLKCPISETYKYFLQCLLTLQPIDRKYFLQSLKLGLDDRSVKLLQPKYEEYEKCRTEEESEERDKKLVQLDQDLTHGSLGIEHFFREIALMYENVNTLKERTDSIREQQSYFQTDNYFGFLTQAIADLVMDGTAIEIMDGDAVDVPVAWLTEVFQKIEGSSDLTVFKVSALGAQSCGKSTLLNTAFGLNFPVSSGRCTRGAYMQLVKVDRALKKQLQCDYVAVIDSEGLMSRTKMGNSDFDNELSTFIIGLSDLTLVVIKGKEVKCMMFFPWPSTFFFE